MDWSSHLDVFNQLESTGSYYNQIVSLGLNPTNTITFTNWDLLVGQITDLLTNPIFYGIVIVCLVASVFTFSD